MTEILTQEKISTGTSITPQLILYNDDFNSFQYVEDCLIRVCKHTPEQAQQCALIVHNKGKCNVLHGMIETLVVPANKLTSLGLTVNIE